MLKRPFEKFARRQAVLALAGLMVLLVSATAGAQTLLPGLGLSAEKDVYVDRIDVEFGTDFTIYVMAMNLDAGGAANQQLTSMPWVIHQVCCGAVVELMDVTFNPALQHTGHPLAGMVSTSDNCLDQKQVWLATLTVRMVEPASEEILWAGGPFGSITDCEGEVPLFTGLGVTIAMVDGEPTPSAQSSWGGLKAVYR